MASFLDLPSELLDHICSILQQPPRCYFPWFRTPWSPKKDVGSFRLVCKDFEEIGAAYVLREIRFCLSQNDFDMLRSIALHPTHHKHVWSLVYILDMLPVGVREVEELDQYLRPEEVYHQIRHARSYESIMEGDRARIV